MADASEIVATDRLAEADRVRRLADRGYRARWLFGIAVLIYDVLLLVLLLFLPAPPPPLPAADWVQTTVDLVIVGVVLNGVARIISPPITARPTVDRLTAERVLHIIG